MPAQSLPSRGAWIEMHHPAVDHARRLKSLPSRGAWIEMLLSLPVATVKKSLPSRGAWIEIMAIAMEIAPAVVAPLAGSVDRNSDLVSTCVKVL